MAETIHARRLRFTVLGCLLFGLLVTHVSVRYLMSALHGFTVYRGLDSSVLLVVSGIYTGSIIVLAAIAMARLETAGGISGAGLVLLAAEPFTTVFESGCQVSAGSGSSLLPEVVVDGITVGISSWNGSCEASLNTAVIAVGLLCVAGGLWMGNFPAIALSRWRAVVDSYYPWC
jgi:hypothetical protein